MTPTHLPALWTSLTPVSYTHLNALFYFHKDNQIFANLELTNPRGTKISLHSDLDEPSNVQSLLCNIQRLELSDLSRVLHLPRMSGRTFMDVRIERVDDQYRATGDLSVNEMTYMDGSLGNVSVAFFYEPRDNASHLSLIHILQS